MSSIVSQSFASPQDASVLCKDTFNIHSFICRKETDCQSRVRERSSVTHSHSWPCRCRNTTGGAERECDGNITSRTSDQRLDHLSIFESITIWGWRGTSRVFECHRDVESSWVIHSSIRFRHWRVRSWWPKGATSRHIPQSCWGLAFPTSNSIYIYITEYIYIYQYIKLHISKIWGRWGILSDVFWVQIDQPLPQVKYPMERHLGSVKRFRGTTSMSISCL